MKQRNTFEFERHMQVLIDPFYRSRGWVVDRSGACREYDCVLSKRSIHYKIEEKFIATEFDYPRFLIEVIQDVKTGNPGWYAHTGCDYLHWVLCSATPYKIYRLKWKPFREYFESEVLLPKWLNVNICRDHFGITLNVPVEWSQVLERGLAESFLIDPLRETA